MKSIDPSEHALPFYSLEDAINKALDNETSQWLSLELDERGESAVYALGNDNNLYVRPLISDFGRWRLAICKDPSNWKLVAIVSRDASTSFAFWDYFRTDYFSLRAKSLGSVVLRPNLLDSDYGYETANEKFISDLIDAILASPVNCKIRGGMIWDRPERYPKTKNTKKTMLLITENQASFWHAELSRPGFQPFPSTLFEVLWRNELSRPRFQLSPSTYFEWHAQEVVSKSYVKVFKRGLFGMKIVKETSWVAG